MITAYHIKTEQFEGPLELLLSMIEERKMSINEVSLAEVSGQYIEHINSSEDMPRSEVASFLVVASTLMLIKSKSLLPTLELSEEERESVEDLERRLKLYKRLKELSLNIRSLYGKNFIYARESFAGMSVGFVEPKNVDVKALYNALKDLMRALPVKEKLSEKVVEKIIKIEDKMAELSERVVRAANISFKDFAGSGDRKSIIVSFLAMLELIKQGLIAAKQERSFGDINISKT